MSCNGYFIQAKPGTYNGTKYASQLEIKMAKILDAHNIDYQTHKHFEVRHRNGKPFTYKVDFVFDYPHKFLGVSGLIIFLEVKGVICPHDIERMDALMYRTNCKGYIATPDIISMWQRCGLTKKIKPPHKEE